MADDEEKTPADENRYVVPVRGDCSTGKILDLFVVGSISRGFTGTIKIVGCRNERMNLYCKKYIDNIIVN